MPGDRRESRAWLTEDSGPIDNRDMLMEGAPYFRLNEEEATAMATWELEKHDRPGIAVAHVVLETDRMEASSGFARLLGMRPIFEGPAVSVYELRGGTHLILMRKDSVAPGPASFDLMVDDLHETHARFARAGLRVSAIEARPAIDHEVFTVLEPAGHVITVFSSHVSGKPV